MRMVSLRGRFAGKLRSHGRVPRLSGDFLEVCILLGCAVHVLLCRMVRRPRRVRRLIAAGVRVVVQWVRTVREAV